MNEDLTIIHLTQNLLPECWNRFQNYHLLKSAGNARIISVSRKPIELGENILQTEPSSPSNVYWQMLKVAKMTDTKYFAVSEDDTLYVEDHFNFRPKDDEFAYNCSRWSLFTWGIPMYSWRDRKTNCCLVANRELVIDALEERFAKYPNGTPPEHTGELGRKRTDKALGLKERKEVYFYTNNPIIQVDHEFGLDERSKRHRKNWGSLRAYDIPTWGKAKDIISHFHEKQI